MGDPKATTASDKAVPSTNTYTFLYSDTSCIPNTQQAEQDLASKHDRFAHTRTKRKRTSQKDVTILEAEYQINAKPDRATRVSLADRVALTEKEVQIWFQNRRQMTRKKRSTWQPNEITSIIRSTQDPIKSTTPSTSPNSSFGPASEPSQLAHNEIAGSQNSIGGTDAPEHEDTTQKELQNVSQEETQTLQPSSHDASSVSEEDTNKSSFSTREFKRTASMVRLAMSLDGKASVIIRGQTPSPPNKTVFSNPLGRSVLQRSQSLTTAPTVKISNEDSVSAPLQSLSRLPGRSRDTRNWEFWCDSERRESLTKSAEIELRGSAAGPISLIRSSSSKKGASTQKKRKSEEALNIQKPKFSRTKSSSARLQSSADNIENVDDLKNNSAAIYADGSDSDKENVDPNTSTVPAPRSIAVPRILGNKRQVLRENTNIPSHSTSLGALLEKEKQNTPTKSSLKKKHKINVAIDKENIDVDPEVANFMKVGSTQGEGEDMDAVENLLRLRQGAWQ